MISRRAVLQLSLSVVFAGLAPLPAAHSQEFKPAISEDVAAAVSRMGKTLLAPQLSFTAKTIREYLDETGQPLHIFQTMMVTARRPDRLLVRVTGDDGAHDLFYDGKSATVFDPDTKKYVVMPVTGEIPSALKELVDKLRLDFPLVNLLAEAPDKAILRGMIGGWQVGTADVDGIECRHLFFSLRGGTDLELWIENNSAALPHRMILTFRLLPAQPSFIVEFTNWDSQVRPPDSVFAFQPPAEAKQIELTAAVPPAGQESER